MTVKGSVHHPMRLVPHRPRLRILRITLLVSGFVIGVIASYFLGIFSVEQTQKNAESTVLNEHQQMINQLTQELTKQQTSAEVDRQTIEQMRKLVVTQKAQLAAADRDLHVYKDLLSPGTKTNPMGISFSPFTASPLAEKGHFNYKVVVQKLSTKEADFIGNLDVKIIGQQAGKDVQLPLYQLSPQMTTPALPLSFKYFQTLEGDIQLPADFTPQYVVLAVRTGDKNSTPLVETQLDWLESSL